MFDAFEKWTPSRVAAGLYNIITGRVASKTWMAEAFLKALDDFFQDPQFASLRRYFFPKKIFRPYKTIAEHNEWFFRSQSPEYRNLVAHRATTQYADQVLNPWGGLEILPCGWLEVEHFVDAFKALLSEQLGMQVFRERFDYRCLAPSSMEADIGGKKMVFDEVVFAEGPALHQNPWFGQLDLRPLKGQVLEIEMEGLSRDFVLLRKVYLVPRGATRFVVGSTYEKDFQDLNPTKEGIDTLVEYIRLATPLPFKIVEARAGIRPTTPNRRPICGRHPDYPGLLVFNGLGTKGVLQAPWCARHFRDWLDGVNPNLLPDLSLERFG